MKPQTTNQVVAGASKVFRWLMANTDLLMLVVLAVIVVASWLAIELADEVMEGTTQRYDEWVLHLLRTPGDMTDPIGPKWFEDMWRDITALGSAAVLLLATLGCAGYLLMRRQHHTFVLLGVATFGGLLVSLLLKGLFDRARPAFDAGLGYVTTSSFPSGHSMLSAVVYLTVGTLLAHASSRNQVKIYFLATAMFVTLLVGVSRVYLGVHYPTDVLAGWSMGLIWALLCWLVAQYLQKHGTIEPPAEPD